MSYNLIPNETNINQNSKIPNLKEFIKYLDQTLKMFDQHIAEEEFEKKDSDVHKLFVALFNIYTDLDATKKENTTNNPRVKSPNQESTLINSIHQPKNKDIDQVEINSIIQQHIENQKKYKPDNFKWENKTRLESEKLAREIYNKSLLELQTTDDSNAGPILFTNAKYDKSSNQITANNNLHKKYTQNTKLASKNKYQKNKTEKICHKSTGKKYYNNNNKINDDEYASEFIKNIAQINSDSDSDNSDIYTSYDTDTEVITHIPPSKKKIKHQYEKTDDIDKKIIALKKILNK